MKALDTVLMEQPFPQIFHLQKNQTWQHTVILSQYFVKQLLVFLQQYWLVLLVVLNLQSDNSRVAQLINTLWPDINL